MQPLGLAVTCPAENYFSVGEEEGDTAAWGGTKCLGRGSSSRLLEVVSGQPELGKTNSSKQPAFRNKSCF